MPVPRWDMVPLGWIQSWYGRRRKAGRRLDWRRRQIFYIPRRYGFRTHPRLGLTDRILRGIVGVIQVGIEILEDAYCMVLWFC